MKAASGNYAITYSATLIFMMLSSQANAACSRDDVNFYLDKGFSTDQIAEMCSESSAPVSETPKAEQAVSPTDDNVLFLNRAIKAQKST